MIINQQNIDKITAQLKKNGWQALMIGPSIDMEYLVDFNFYPDERLKAFFVTVDGECFCVAPEIYRAEGIEHFGKDFPLYFWDDNEWYYDTLSCAFADFKLNNSKIAVNQAVRASDAADIATKDKVTFHNGSNILASIRAIKDSGEIANLKRSSEIADQVMIALGRHIKAGMTELEIAHFVIDRYLEFGGSRQPGSLPLIASGPNGALSHYDKGLRIIEENDVVVVDSGCTYNGYHSDTTRTFFVGAPTEEQRKVFNIVLEAQALGEKTVKPGVKASDVDMAVREYITSKGYGPLFNHRTGHGIGREGHELPYISSSDNTVLEPGMTFSIEPGIYLPGEFGIRIENIVLVTEDGCISLNNAPKHFGI